MPPLPVLTPNELVRVLEQQGYIRHRQKGSHLILIQTNSSKQITVPMHARDLRKGTLRSIIRQMNITVDEFVRMI